MAGFFKQSYLLLKETFNEFSRDSAFRHGAAISYYTVFSLPPILIIILSLAGLFLGEAEVRQELLLQMEQIVGDANAKDMVDLIDNINQDKNSFWATVLSIGTLIFGATGVFYTLQDSLNTIWGIPLDLRKGMIKMIIDRVLSFTMVISFGFILLVSMLFETFLIAMSNFLHREDVMEKINIVFSRYLFIDDSLVWMIYLIDITIMLFVVVVIFAMIFKFLPNAKVDWRDVLAGALFTTILFFIGKLVIGWYIGSSDVASMYGTAGSIVVLLIWVYYSSQIVLLGGEFTQAYAKLNGRDIEPSVFAKKISGNNPFQSLKRRFKSDEKEEKTVEEQNL